MAEEPLVVQNEEKGEPEVHIPGIQRPMSINATWQWLEDNTDNPVFVNLSAGCVVAECNCMWCKVHDLVSGIR